MRAGNSMNNRSARKLRGFTLVVLLLGYSLFAHAIDNPDAPDYISDFLNRAQAHERDIQQTAHTTQGYLAAYEAYENFLDQELNAAYNQLMAYLSGETQHALKNSQLKWLNYRDREFDFVARNWTTEKFGSSAVISRGDYRTKLIKDRVMLLLHYLRNY